MKKILTIFFVTLGVIFSVLILAGVVFFITDPLNLKPLFSGGGATFSETANNGTTNGVDNVGTGSRLSPAQQQALETFGIDPARLPSEITPEQEVCFEATLGAARVAEIKAGATPTMTEYMTAKDCI